ncbi:hypothetical protein M2352_001857 [Azospirillum fermentarium]|uniref:hypothetical protein n=1 Tax=Azospirillum fermentarium TaxID=1233114 RepID=UPI0022267A34|nr:hypothetical protein [Azospirillum fermentarium]MCW2246266.1 hypothetical protein [Azospirillum fermentarium]
MTRPAPGGGSVTVGALLMLEISSCAGARFRVPSAARSAALAKGAGTVLNKLSFDFSGGDLYGASLIGV